MSGRNFVSNEMAGRIEQSVAYTENIGNPTRPTKRRIVRQRGGGDGGARAYVKITSIVSASEYKGNLLTSPTNDAVITAGVSIFVKGAQTNPLQVGYDNFADVATDAGVSTYYLDGYLLG